MIDVNRLKDEIVVQTSRSGGKGGQHVNKVETKVSLRLDLMNSKVLTQEQVMLLKSKLKHLLTKGDVLVVSGSTARTQLENKAIALKKLLRLIEHTIKPVKKRLKTNIPKGSIQERMNSKKKRSEIKSLRKKVILFLFIF